MRNFPAALLTCTLGVLVLYWVAFAPNFGLFVQPQRASARTQCLSNVKLQATAGLIYAASYDDHLPNAMRWMDQVTPYAPGRLRLQCPDVKSGFGYAMAIDLSDKKLTSLRTPATTVFLFESDDLSRNAHGRPRLVTSHPRHKLWNYAYADGHAKGQRTP